MGKIVGQTKLFSFDMAAGLKERNIWILISWKIDPLLYSAYGGEVW